MAGKVAELDVANSNAPVGSQELGVAISGSVTLTSAGPAAVGSFNAEVASEDGGVVPLSGTFDVMYCTDLPIR